VAATNAISDVYAMGGTPIMALAILGIPVGKLPTEMAAKILEGGSAVCAAAGIPVAGGHSIDSPEPIYGLAVIGTCKEKDIRRNADAQVGDAIILTKALGVGIYAAAFKKGALSDGAYADMIASMTLLNRVGTRLAKDAAVHAMTDVTGFGLFGHAMEMARGSNATIVLKATNVPLLPEASDLVRQGFFTGASVRNWASYSDGIRLSPEFPEWQRHLCTDPQTSGGLLIACDATHAEAILRRIIEDGYPYASMIGYVERGEPSVRILD
jgi:selenide,water dikinase